MSYLCSRESGVPANGVGKRGDEHGCKVAQQNTSYELQNEDLYRKTSEDFVEQLAEARLCFIMF